VSTPRPEITPGKVLVEVFAAGVNFPDLLSLQGKYPVRSEPPFVLGIEGAGRVIEAGADVDGLSVGDLVCWQDNANKSAFAEYALVSAEAAARVPAGFDPILAAATPTTYGTAFFALFHHARLQPGEILLVHGASGGTGTAAVQLGRHMGAKVIATGTSKDKLRIVREMGADATIDLTEGNFRDQVKALTDGKGVDVVFDPVGGDLFEPSVRALRPYGRMLVIGFTSGAFPSVAANIVLAKAVSVIGVNYGHYLATQPAAACRALETVLGWMAQGRFAPRINAIYPLERAADAIDEIAARGVVGKNVLAISQQARARISI
jgi:NADPH2:quinone reductase